MTNLYMLLVDSTGSIGAMPTGSKEFISCIFAEDTTWMIELKSIQKIFTFQFLLSQITKIEYTIYCCKESLYTHVWFLSVFKREIHFLKFNYFTSSLF